MSSHTTASFRKTYDSLPEEIQDRAQEAFLRFEEDPSHPSLRFKKVHPKKAIYSARVTVDYRALALQSGEDWIWFWIGSHSDYEQLLKRL